MRASGPKAWRVLGRAWLCAVCGTVVMEYQRDRPEVCGCGASTWEAHIVRVARWVLER